VSCSLLRLVNLCQAAPGSGCHLWLERTKRSYQFVTRVQSLLTYFVCSSGHVFYSFKQLACGRQESIAHVPTGGLGKASALLLDLSSLHSPQSSPSPFPTTLALTDTPTLCKTPDLQQDSQGKRKKMDNLIIKPTYLHCFFPPSLLFLPPSLSPPPLPLPSHCTLISPVFPLPPCLSEGHQRKFHQAIAAQLPFSPPLLPSVLPSVLRSRNGSTSARRPVGVFGVRF